MKIANLFSRTLLLVPCCALVLSGCGGSSGSGGGGTQAAPVAITQANAGQVANSTLSGTLAAGQTAAVSNPFELLAPSCLAPNVTVTATGFGDGTFDVGDEIVVTFTNCVIDGQTLNGTVTITVTAITGDPNTPTPPWSLTLTTTFDDLTNGSGSNLSDSFSVTIAADAMGELTFAFDGNDLEFAEGDIDLDGVMYEELPGNRYQIVLDTTVTLDGLGQATVQTTAGQPLTGNAGDPPDGGQVVITGEDSTLTLTFNGGGTVLVELDEDGDGNVDLSDTVMIVDLAQFGAP